MWDIITLFISDGDDPLLYLRMGDLNGHTWLPQKMIFRPHSNVVWPLIPYPRRYRRAASSLANQLGFHGQLYFYETLTSHVFYDVHYIYRLIVSDYHPPPITRIDIVIWTRADLDYNLEYFDFGETVCPNSKKPLRYMHNLLYWGQMDHPYPPYSITRFTH